MVLNKKISRKNNSIGQIFTPDFIAEFMVKNSLKFINNASRLENNWKIRTLEPSVGKGVFLKFLIQNNVNDITAYELDENLEPYLLDTYPQVKFKFENVLGSDFEEKFDLIIGNPPYLGQNYNAELFQEYCKKYPICKKYFVGNMDLFYFFIHLGIKKLNPGGILTFITTNYWITKSQKTGIKFLKPHILDECFLLQYIDLSKLKLFEGATGQHNCIFVLQKKTVEDKIQNPNKKIEIIQIKDDQNPNQISKLIPQKIFENLSNGINSSYISATANKDLRQDQSWNLIFPPEVKIIVDKIEDYCRVEGKISYLKDYFIIRNGLILIKDSIFILKEGVNLKVKNDDFFIAIDGAFTKLTEEEKNRLKKVYKSKSIRPHGYEKDSFIGHAIYFNKNEFKTLSVSERNHLIEMKYPNLSTYLKQHEKNLREILINAKENPEDFFFPRRGSFIRRFEENKQKPLIDLEPLFDQGKKIFFKFISNENVFGYSSTQYYATSDTYFLWPKISDKELDYLFILAYLNSKIVNFLFKVKNISIKRSKTKLEHGLPIPYLELFHSDTDLSILRLIKLLSSYMIKIVEYKNQIFTGNFLGELNQSKYFCYKRDKELISKINLALEKNDQKFIQDTIDKLFFELFSLNEDKINEIITKFY